ncbi:MAG: hypothetical protein WBX15_14155 [Thermoanaerobaculia bacterium]
MSKRVAVNITDEHRALTRVRDLAAEQAARILSKTNPPARDLEWARDIIRAINDALRARAT